MFQVLEEVREDEVTSLLESVVNLVVRIPSIVGVNAQGCLGALEVQEVEEVVWWSRVVIWMTNVVNTIDW